MVNLSIDWKNGPSMSIEQRNGQQSSERKYGKLKIWRKDGQKKEIILHRALGIKMRVFAHAKIFEKHCGKRKTTS